MASIPSQPFSFCLYCFKDFPNDDNMPAPIGLVLLEDEISGLLFTIFAKHFRHFAAVLRSK